MSNKAFQQNLNDKKGKPRMGKKKLFPKREKSKSHTQSNNGKEHCAVIFKDRNKTHHPGTLLPMALPTFYLLYHAGTAVSMQTGFLQK